MSNTSFSAAVEPGTGGHAPLVVSWRDVPIVAVSLGGEPLDLAQTLYCGQAFRWRRVTDRGSGEYETWEGVASGRVWRLRQADDALLVQVVPALDDAEVTAFIRHYFWLDLPAAAVQRAVAAAHPLAARAVEDFAGLRVLRQDATEVLLTFAIASATNVPRVTRSVALMCERFGEVIAAIDGVPYHAFPTPAAIAAATTEDLFGPCNLAYRARHIQSFARALLDGVPSPPPSPRREREPASPAGRGRPSAARTGEGEVTSPAPQSHPWLARLAARSYAEAHAALDALPFCGPKVADCICLFGLGFAEAVPVDVHVWAIAHDLFGASIPTRTLTPTTYQRVGSLYRDLFGPYAGWAQQYLYAARRATPMRERSRPQGS